MTLSTRPPFLGPAAPQHYLHEVGILAQVYSETPESDVPIGPASALRITGGDAKPNAMNSLYLVSLGVLIMACGASSEPTAAGDAATDGSVLGDASTESSTSGSKTKTGASCNVEEYNTPTDCNIPGTYTVTENACSSPDSTCTDYQSVEAGPYPWTATVTVTGDEIKLTNGTNRLIKCKLTDKCGCFGIGRVFGFTNTGFVGFLTNMCSSGKTQQLTHTSGTRI